MTRSSAVVWHDLECGAYSADLDLWRELADEAGGPILDVGAGTGRVSLALARAGHDVVALDLDADLLAALTARTNGTRVQTVCADARSFDLGREFGLMLVPMQTIQLLGPDDRRAFLARAAAHLAPGGVLALALADALEPFEPGGELELPLPDTGSEDGVAYVSQPIRIREERDSWVIERTRRRGEHTEHDEIRLHAVLPGGLEDEGRAAGLIPHPRRRIAPTDEHVGSDVVVLARG